MNAPLNPLTALLFAGLFAALALYVSAVLRKALRARKLRRRFIRAANTEAQAPALLRERGYAVLGAQVRGDYCLTVDGRPFPVELRADYVVSRDKKRYVAEVKSGKLAPRLATAATRRQLLEYLMAFEVDGVLLVDGEARQIHEVEFPTRNQLANASPKGERIALLAAILFAVAVAYLVFLR